MRRRPCRWPTTAMSSRPDASPSTAGARTCCMTSGSARPTSARTDRSSARTGHSWAFAPCATTVVATSASRRGSSSTSADDHRDDLLACTLVTAGRPSQPVRREERAVPRSPVFTRTASLADVPSLAALWRELREVGGRAEGAVNPVAIPDIEQRLAATIQDGGCRVVLATAEGQPAGMAVFRVWCPDPLSSSEVVQVLHVIVADGKRRLGVGHALVAAAADFAEDRHVEHLTAGMYPSLRDASRFYARLGFAPVLVQRVASVAAVPRRLGADGHSRTDDVVRRRSRLRRQVPPQRPAAPASQTAEGA